MIDSFFFKPQFPMQIPFKKKEMHTYYNLKSGLKNRTWN